MKTAIIAAGWQTGKLADCQVGSCACAAKFKFLLRL